MNVEIPRQSMEDFWEEYSNNLADYYEHEMDKDSFYATSEPETMLDTNSQGIQWFKEVGLIDTIPNTVVEGDQLEFLFKSMSLTKRQSRTVRKRWEPFQKKRMEMNSLKSKEIYVPNLGHPVKQRADVRSLFGQVSNSNARSKFKCNFAPVLL